MVGPLRLALLDGLRAARERCRGVHIFLNVLGLKCKWDCQGLGAQRAQRGHLWPHVVDLHVGQLVPIPRCCHLTGSARTSLGHTGSSSTSSASAPSTSSGERVRTSLRWASATCTRSSSRS